MDSTASPHRHACVRAFEEQFEFVHRTLRRQGVPESDVEDLAQEVFIVMWRRWSDFDPRRGLRPWLAGIAFNVAGSRYLRRRRMEIPMPEPEAFDPAPHGEDGLAAMRARRVLLKALDRLSPNYRNILVLRDIEGVPMRQIAALQQVPIFTAYTRLRRARRDFARAVKEQAAEPRRRPLFVTFAQALAPAALAALVVLVWPDRPVSPAATGTSLSSLASGLLGYWRFDEAAGETARDLSGLRGDCQLRRRDTASPWTAGRLGAAVQLDSSRWLECPQPALSQAGAGELTVSTWFRVRSLPARANRALVSRQLGHGSEDHFFLGFINGRLSLSSHSWNVKIFDQPLDRRWHHVAFTKSSTAVTLFVDGVAVRKQALRQLRPDPIDAPMLVGGGSNQPDVVHELIDGTVDELLLYERALSPDEIAALAAGVQPALQLSARNAD